MISKVQVSGSKAVRILLAVAATAALGGTAVAHEGDHWPVTGEKLKMVWTANGAENKFQFRTKNQININPISLMENPTTERSTLIVMGSEGGSSTPLIDLSPMRWSPIGPEDSPKGWKYKGDLYDDLGVSKIQIKAGKTDGSLQIQAKGAYWLFDLEAPQDFIKIVLTIGEFAYCAEFSADRMADFKTNEAGDLQASLSLAPGDCPAVCSNGILEDGEECDDGNLLNDDTCSDQCIGCNPMDAEFASTFEGIQELIFDDPNYGCSNDACHGSGTEGNLDLREGASYAALLNVPSDIDPDTVRVFPGDQDLSMLYQKIAAKTLSTDVLGSAMPSNEYTVPEEYLEAIRLWIRGGAPETGVVAGTAELLGSCLPPATPLDIPQPPVPDPSVGTQFAQPGYNLPSGDEIEGCIATYYDVSSTVPPSMIVDCPYICDAASPANMRGQSCNPLDADPCGAGACEQMFTGTNPGGQCFSYRGNELYQDAQSHHSIVHIYPGEADWDDSGWGSWRCYGGPTPDAACDPTTADPCGSGGVCGGVFHHGVACLDTLLEDWGADDFNTSDAPTFSGAQESTANFNFPTGVYNVLPVRGLIVWNSHAFNLTNQDTAMEAWINITYTDQRTWPAQALFANQWIFTQNVLPFERKEYCATHTFPEGTKLFQLGSHTHKRGVRWRYYDAPQTACFAPGGNANASCVPTGTILEDNDGNGYESYDYSDPLTINFDPPKTFSGTAEERTIKFCSLYDNGFTDPADVKRRSTSPTPTGNLIIGGPCSASATYCIGGTNQGAACNGNNANCDSGVCDACTLLGGVTTEDEMYIATGTYYVDP